jgi:hypothetical protein
VDEKPVDIVDKPVNNLFIKGFACAKRGLPVNLAGCILSD